MNINSIQAGQLSQNAIRPADKNDYGVNTGLGSLSAHTQGEAKMPQVSTQGIAVGINYLKDTLDTLLTSFPTFFPAGSPQRVDLIKKIQSLEEQIGMSSADNNLKKTITENKLPDKASDQDISASLDRLIDFRDAVKQAEPQHSTPLNPGIIINVKV